MSLGLDERVSLYGMGYAVALFGLFLLGFVLGGMITSKAMCDDLQMLGHDAVVTQLQKGGYCR